MGKLLFIISSYSHKDSRSLLEPPTPLLRHPRESLESTWCLTDPPDLTDARSRLPASFISPSPTISARIICWLILWRSLVHWTWCLERWIVRYSHMKHSSTTIII